MYILWVFRLYIYIYIYIYIFYIFFPFCLFSFCERTPPYLHPRRAADSREEQEEHQGKSSWNGNVHTPCYDACSGSPVQRAADRGCGQKHRETSSFARAAWCAKYNHDSCSKKVRSKVCSRTFEDHDAVSLDEWLR